MNTNLYFSEKTVVANHEMLGAGKQVSCFCPGIFRILD
jgi:hypothetical protein